MEETDLYQRVAARTGASLGEVEAVVGELLPQAFHMAADRGGKLVIPHFATFKCRPCKRCGLRFVLKPHRAKAAGAAAGGRSVPRPLEEPSVPEPPPCPARQAGFLARLLRIRS